MKRFVPVLLAWVALAQKADLITDHMRYEIAAAQRDYLLAQQQFDKAAEKLKLKLGEAQKTCSDQDKVFDMQSFTCIAK